MLAAVSRSLPSVEPLIAEAKRRARQRHVLLAVIALVLLLGGGTAVAYRPLGWLHGTRAYSGPYEPGGVFTGTGGPVLGYDAAGLTSASAASSDAAWIVGPTTAWHWTGTGWRGVALPKTGGGYLNSVAAVTPDDAFAVGWRGDGEEARSHAYAVRWNGTGWKSMPLPSLGGSMLFAVSAASPRDVWAVGGTFRSKPNGRPAFRKTRPLLLHWDGVAWRVQPLPWSRPQLVLDKVVATGPSSVWVLSTGNQDENRIAVEHWNGSSWQAVPAPFGLQDGIAGFSARSAGDAWAVGSYGVGGNEVAKDSHPLAAHWNGSRWQVTSVPSGPGDNDAALADVSEGSADNVWAIGPTQHIQFSHDGLSARGLSTLLVHWDGRRWQVAPGAPAGMTSATTVAAAPDGSAWAVGGCQVQNILLRWSGGTWAPVAHPADQHWNSGFPTSMRRHRTRSCAKF